MRAFEAFGGVPTGMIRYDNLKPAVIRIALGRERFEHPRFVAMRSHYGYDSFFCAPGIEGAHEKGGVEGEIGRFRRRHLTPIPHVGSLAALNLPWLPRMPATTPAGSPAGPRPSARRRPERRLCCGRCPPSRSMWRCGCRAGWMRRPGFVSGSPITRCRPVTSAAASRCGWAPPALTVYDGASIVA